MADALIFDVFTAKPGMWIAQWQPPQGSGAVPVTGSGLTEIAALKDLRDRVAEFTGLPAQRVQLRRTEAS